MTITPIVTPDQLTALGPIRLLYVPEAEERPQGLTPVPMMAWINQAKQSETGFDDLGYWQKEIGQLGIGYDALTVVVDGGGLNEAARVWFILQYFGLPASVLNGGLPELDRLPYQAAPASNAPKLSPGAGPVRLMGRQSLRNALKDVQILDARSAEEFAGKDLKGNARGGHLPGAINLDHRNLLNGRHLRSERQLAEMLANAGFDGSRPTVSHCNGGGRAALAALAAVAAGQQDVRVYYLSFADWAADESCPLQKAPSSDSDEQ